MPDNSNEAKAKLRLLCAGIAEERAELAEPPNSDIVAGEPREPVRSRMIALPGGTFLMGTENPEGFPQDGKGPVRPVTLDGFLIHRCSVTNDVFQCFIAATGYRTDARNGSVGLSCSGPIYRKRVFVNWWPIQSTLGSAAIIPWCMSHETMRRRSVGGRGSGCRQKRSGSYAARGFRQTFSFRIVWAVSGLRCYMITAQIQDSVTER